MGSNVWVKSGKVMDMLPNPTQGGIPVTGATTGNWVYKDAPSATFQAVVNGTGAIGATITIQVSNDGINAVATSLGTITLSGTTVVSDGFTTSSPWKYVRAVVSAPSGTISSILCIIGV